MDLIEIINDLAADYAVLASGVVIAHNFMKHAYSRYPYYIELKLKDEKTRSKLKKIKEKGFSKHLAIDLADKMAIAAGLYVLDSLTGLEKDTVNLHNIYCYGTGGFGYMSSLILYLDLKRRQKMIDKN